MIKRTIIFTMVLAACTTTALAGPNCTCRFQGENFQIGEVACILGQLKQCEMKLNNTSWRTLSEGCPQARLPQSDPVPGSNAATGYQTSALISEMPAN